MTVTEVAATKPLVIEELGLRPYLEAWEVQQDRLAARIAGEIPDTLILCQHPSVVTVGRGGGQPNQARHPVTGAAIPVVAIERGGEATWHGPGQLVGYPIVDLRPGKDVHGFLRRTEELLIRCIARWGLIGERRKGLTGVWVGDRKVASIGIAVRRWVTWHGFALNVDPDLACFGAITPCGLDPQVMTSLDQLLGPKSPTLEQVARQLRTLAPTTLRE